MGDSYFVFGVLALVAMVLGAWRPFGRGDEPSFPSNTASSKPRPKPAGKKKSVNKQGGKRK